MNDEKEAVELYNLGIGAREKGNISLAFDFFTRALEAHPGLINARVHLAVVANMLSLRNNHIHETAFYNAQAAARAKPNDLSYWLVYGEICLNQHKFPEAIAAYEKALTIDLDANKGFLWGLLGFAQVRWAKFDEARSSLEKAVELNPELGTPHFILSGLYYERYFDPERVAYHGERAFQAKIPCLDPIAAKWNSAHGYLITGDYIKGWDYFEARLSRNGTNLGIPLALERYPGKPLWRGEKGIRLLVQREMGLGDDFIMMRYFPMLRSRYGCDVQFECHPSMLEFVRQNFPDINCVAVGAVDPESFDMQIPIMSLPVVFRTRSYQVPGDGPYLHAEQARVEEWRARLPLKPGMLNVGVCWFSGRNSESADNHHTSKRKSLTFDQIKPLLDVPGVNFVSLQVDRDGQFKNPGIRDFGDTAALIALMDVVITVDTAVANLAGAMGANLWVLNRYDMCWRWQPIRTPWFPTARSYRQETPGAWEPLVAKIIDDLAEIQDKIRHAA